METQSTDFIEPLKQWSIYSYRHILKNHIQMAKSHGLNPSQMITLGHLSHHHTSSLKDLSKMLGISSPAVSQMLDKMVQSELIIRQEDPHDRRYKTHKLSDKGKYILRKLQQKNLQWLDQLLKDLPQEKQTVLEEAFSILNTLYKDFEKEVQ